MEIHRFINQKPAGRRELEKWTIPNRTVYQVLRAAKRREDGRAE